MPNILRSWLETRRSPTDEPGTILAQARSAGHFSDLQDLVDKSFRAARVGIWECTLPDETLRWTDTVFELFDLEPQAKISRDEIVSLYTDDSRKQLKQVRDEALRNGGGFTLDAEIVTAKGNSRWIRITAIVEHVEGVPVRLFGMKQDITAEKAMFEQVRRLTEVDGLTGLASRSKFEQVFGTLCATRDGQPHALLLIDLDGFKAVNDTLGHQEGDDYLRLTARRLLEAAPQAHLVARLGGDEFAVIHPVPSPSALEELASRIASALDDRTVLAGSGIRVSASLGGALLSQDRTPKEIFSRADKALYRVKSEGKSTFNLDLTP